MSTTEEYSYSDSPPARHLGLEPASALAQSESEGDDIVIYSAESNASGSDNPGLELEAEFGRNVEEGSAPDSFKVLIAQYVSQFDKNYKAIPNLVQALRDNNLKLREIRRDSQSYKTELVWREFIESENKRGWFSNYTVLVAKRRRVRVDTDYHSNNTNGEHDEKLKDPKHREADNLAHTITNLHKEYKKTLHELEQSWNFISTQINERSELFRDLSGTEYNDLTLLTVFIKHGEVDKVRFLLQHGIDYRLANPMTYALDLALSETGTDEHWGCLDVLRQANAPIYETADYHNVLYQLIKLSKQSDWVLEMIERIHVESSMSDIECYDVEGRSTLHLLKNLNEFASARANPNIVQDGLDVFTYAISQKDLESAISVGQFEGFLPNFIGVETLMNEDQWCKLIAAIAYMPFELCIQIDFARLISTLHACIENPGEKAYLILMFEGIQTKLELVDVKAELAELAELKEHPFRVPTPMPVVVLEGRVPAESIGRTVGGITRVDEPENHPDGVPKYDPACRVL